MKATLTAIIAAIEACAVALAGISAVALPGVLLWWLVFGMGADPSQLASLLAAVWQLAHLVPMQLSLTPEAALGFGLPPEALSFTISLAPLGLTLLTALLAGRSGWRFGGRRGIGASAVLGGAVGFAAAALLLAGIAAPFSAWPLWAAVAVPALVYGACAGAGFVARAIADDHDWWAATVRALQRGLEPLSPRGAAAFPARASETFRLAAAGFAGLVGIAALGFTAAMLAGYVEMVTLSQGLQLDPLGAVLVLLLQAALLPVAWAWSLAWFSGAGFAIGAATSVTPFETLLGPVPALPLLGAVPQGWGWAGGFAPALVVVFAVVVGGLAGARRELRSAPWYVALGVPLCAGLVIGAAAAGLSALAGGAAGPGRLAETGADPWLVGGLLAVETAFGMALGVFARRVDVDRLREAVPASAPRPEPNLEEAAVAAAVVEWAARAQTQQAVRIERAAPHEPAAQIEPLEPDEQVESGDPVDPLVQAFSWESGEPPPGRRRRWQGGDEPS